MAGATVCITNMPAVTSLLSAEQLLPSRADSRRRSYTIVQDVLNTVPRFALLFFSHHASRRRSQLASAAT